MKQHIKRSTALLVCLAMLMSFLGGIPGSFVTKASATETTANLAISIYAPFDDVANLDELLASGWYDPYGHAANVFSIVEDADRGGNVLKFAQTEADTAVNAHGIRTTDYIPVIASTTIKVSLDLKGTYNEIGVQAYWYDANKTACSTARSEKYFNTVTTTWTTYTQDWTVPSDAAYMQFVIYQGKSAVGEVCIDDLKVSVPVAPTNTNSVSAGSSCGKTVVWPTMAAAGTDFEGFAKLSDMGTNSTTSNNPKLGWFISNTNQATLVTDAERSSTVLSLVGTTFAIGTITPLVDVRGMDKVNLSFDLKSNAELNLNFYPFDASGNLMANNWKGVASTSNVWEDDVTVQYDLPEGAAYLRVYLNVSRNVTETYLIDNLDLECVHANGNADHVCDACGATLSQCADTDNDHLCDVCTKPLTECADNDNDHNCDTCGEPVSECADNDSDHNCDTCGEPVSECADNDNDHNCDTCGDPVSECADNDNDHNCDTCGDPVSECADNDNDHNCDTCGDPVSECADNDNDHNCDTCGEPVSECADNDNDHNCDTCGDPVSECADNDNDHNCDTCGEPVSECADNDNDHNCDTCGEPVSECADNDSDHNCDTCGDPVSECADEDGDYLCDVCGEALADPVAKVGETEYYTLADAIAAAEANGTVTLIGTINLDEAGVTIDKNLTIELNGQTVNSLGDVFVCTAGTLTINGEGDINAGLQDQGDYVAVWANGGTVIIRGGTWSCGGDSRPHAKGHQNDVIYVGKLGGRIEVYAGYFEYTDEVWTLNESDIQRGSLKVYGGTFEQLDPSNGPAQASGDPSFVAEGYTVEENNDVYTVVEMPEAATNTRFGETLSLLVGYVQEELGNPLTQNLVGQLTKADGTVITLENWTQTTDASTGTAYYVLELSGLFADEMTVTFEVVVLDANGNAVTKTEELSIRSYAMNILENSTDSEYKTLIVDMLNYGAEAEKKFAGKSDSDDLANSLLNNDQKALATDVMGTVSNTRDPQDIGGVFQGSNVRFTEEINLLFRLDIELDTYAVFTWKDHNGEDQRVVVENEDYTKSGDYYVVELVGLVVADARQTVTCEIYNNGETTNPVLTISDSIAANVARVTGDYVNLYQAFMKFADSANNYMH